MVLIIPGGLWSKGYQGDNGRSALCFDWDRRRDFRGKFRNIVKKRIISKDPGRAQRLEIGAKDGRNITRQELKHTAAVY
ncbi:MAG: hypothetical protein GX335_06395 [Firmicutes bacterium]|nr:hypothetical protein [Bacillota bacterium]